MKYAHVEREVRYLLLGLPSDLAVTRTVEIHDRYIEGTGLRLRVMLSGDGEPIRKLGQKVRRDETESIAHTTMYLSEAEHRLLSGLPARELSKTRHLAAAGQLTMAMDVFHGLLEGLVMAEIDLGEHGARPAEPPLAAVSDVTDDPRFAGGALSKTTTAELADLMSTYGLGSRGFLTGR